MAALKTFVLWLLAATLIAALVAGPTRVRDWLFPVPDVPRDWAALLAEVRAFERRMGFLATDNFGMDVRRQADHTICGYAPRFVLPYSYQDPAIRWANADNAEACSAGANGNDVYFAQTEAMGEVATPMTVGIASGKLDRFLYLVIHEDCHDQFDFPYGFEEALCNLLGYRGMSAFALERYRALSAARLSVRAYADTQERLTHAVVQYYRQVEELYARHTRGEIAAAAVLIARARVFGAAERTLGWDRHTLNNVGLANEMTYSRHYPLQQRVHEALGGDLAQTVAFFKRVDRLKPPPAAVMAQQHISDEKDVRFVRAYEAAVVNIVQRQLAQRRGSAAPGPLE
jgi:hypothetical protein